MIIASYEIISCPFCKGTDIEIFNPANQKCVKCGEGNYKVVEWFESLQES